jgi:hypothetical protein
MAVRCRIENIYAVADALHEHLVIQVPYQQPCVGDGVLMLTKNATDTRWCHALMAHATALCLPHGRLKETTTMQGATLFYFGEQVEAFTRLCKPFGLVLFPMHPKGGA